MTSGPSPARRASIRFMRLPLRDDPWHRSKASCKVASHMAVERIVLPHSYRAIDPAVRRELVEHAATDGFPLTGVLYRPARTDPDVVVLAMHPRADFTRHYLAPQLTAAGYAFLGATTRYLNHDADALHERLLLDLAGTTLALPPGGA